MTATPCRACGTPLRRTFCDLGMSPLSNRYLAASELNRAEPFYPLHAYVCESCLLVQLEAFESPEAIFSDYAYFSSYSDTWLAHAERYVSAVIQRFALAPATRVVEIASNDGYLLQYFKRRGFPILGIEPAANVARVAEERGIPTRSEFFSARCAARLVSEGRAADLIVANNVLAHVPDLNDFVEGVRILLAQEGVATFEFPHLLRLMLGNQFDTIYHEHFSYFSLTAVSRVFAAHGLRVFDVEELATHGGSLRLYVAQASARHREGPGVQKVSADERAAGLTRLEGYAAFPEQVRETKRKLLEVLIAAKRAGKSIAGYGAAAKGNTLLNYCGIRDDFIDYVADRSPHKQGRYLPGTHIRIEPPERLAATRPDYVLILPWNIKDEVMAQNAHIRDWGGRFLIPVPAAEVV
jgi:2-polyprenyl-3-methyl-5-hydroxy-6-metoxy-1,4-benzoquinol methylase